MGNPVRPLQSEFAPGPVPVIELPRRREVSPKLNKAAERLGFFVGSVEAQLRQMPSRMDQLRSKINQARTRPNDTAVSEWRQSAQQRAQDARSRAQYLANEYPVEAIAGAAGTAFAVGFALRIWRSNHARRK